MDLFGAVSWPGRGARIAGTDPTVISRAVVSAMAPPFYRLSRSHRSMAAPIRV
jgi:hypothetical protein